MIPGLRNRRRIWHALRDVSQGVGYIMKNRLSPDPGIAVGADNVFSSTITGAIPVNVRTGPMICGEVLTEDQRNETLRLGCRRLLSQRLIWPELSEFGHLDIGVSFIHIGSERFISGVRLLPGNSDRDCTEVSSIGLIGPSSEKKRRFQGVLEGIDVAVNLSGIVGLSFLGRVSPSLSSIVFGDLDTGKPGLGVGKLIPSKGKKIYGLEAGLDVCLPLNSRS